MGRSRNNYSKKARMTEVVLRGIVAFHNKIPLEEVTINLPSAHLYRTPKTPAGQDSIHCSTSSSPVH